MRRRAAIVLLLAMLATGCGGIFGDPWPTSRKVEERIPAGGSERDTVQVAYYVDDVVWDDVDVDDVPPGIHYETKGVYVDPFGGDLLLDYRIRVDEWVAPGIYRFHVHYEYVEDEDDWFRNEVVVRFTVRVLEPEPGEESGPLELRARQSLSPGVPESEVILTSSP